MAERALSRLLRQPVDLRADAADGLAVIVGDEILAGRMLEIRVFPAEMGAALHRQLRHVERIVAVDQIGRANEVRETAAACRHGLDVGHRGVLRSYLLSCFIQQVPRAGHAENQRRRPYCRRRRQGAGIAEREQKPLEDEIEEAGGDDAEADAQDRVAARQLQAERRGEQDHDQILQRFGQPSFDIKMIGAARLGGGGGVVVEAPESRQAHFRRAHAGEAEDAGIERQFQVEHRAALHRRYRP